MVTCNFLAPNGEKSLLYGALEQKYGADRATQLWNWSRSKSFEETLSKIPEITGNAPQLDMNGEPSIAAVEAAIDWNQLTSANIGGRRFKGQMTFEYGGNARPGMGAKSTLQAIRMGERTATTRYEADGHFDYWKQAQVGDIIEFTGADGSVVEVRVTKPFTKLTPDTSAEEWSKKEGWSVEYFEKKVRPKIAKGAWQIEYEYVSKAVSTPVKKGPTGWGRNATTDGMNYEVSTKGDDRFSALKAKLADGRTIEEAYQLDVKGYRVQGNDWKLGKGKKPLVNITPEESWRQYKALWQQWAKENPALIEELREKQLVRY